MILLLGFVLLPMIRAIALPDSYHLEGNIDLFNIFQLAAPSLLFFGITTLSSVIGGLLYQEFLTNYSRFFAFHGASPFPTLFFKSNSNKKDRVSLLKEKLDDKRRALMAMQKELDAKQKELISYKVQVDVRHFGGVMHSLKESTINAYKVGYQHGQGLVKQNRSEIDEN